MTRKPFKFKEFTIEQEHTAMPVCTDSCVFGALVELPHSINILDIGTGTGLLSLMLAQKYKEAKITAVEIDENEAENAAINFKNSKWSDRINLVISDINSWDSGQQFEGIVCNPPFFENQLKSESTTYNRARHQVQLTFEHLLATIQSKLKKEGLSFCLVPNLHFNKFINLLPGFRFYLKRVVAFQNNSSSFPHVHMVEFGFSETTTVNYEQLIFKNEDSTYSDSFKQLMKAYYSAL